MPDKIGNYEMIRLSGKPSRPMQQWDRSVRTGAHGVQLWDTGNRAEVMEFESEAWAPTLIEACQLFTQYTLLCGNIPQEIEFGGHKEPNCVYQVMRVEPVQGEVEAQLKGIQAGSAVNWQGKLVAHWWLQPLHEVPP